MDNLVVFIHAMITVFLFLVARIFEFVYKICLSDVIVVALIRAIIMIAGILGIFISKETRGLILSLGLTLFGFLIMIFTII